MKYICFIFCCLFSVSVFSQIDASRESTSIPVVKSEEGSQGTSLLESKPIENKGLSNTNSDKINGLSVPKQNEMSDPNDKGFSMFSSETFGNPAELYKNRFNKQEQEFKNVIESDVIGATTDQYLGDFKTKSTWVKLLYRDSGAVDGDLIRVYLDQEVIDPSFFLKGNFSGINIELKPGFNVFEFQALTQGDAPPNTAQVIVVDDDGNIIASSGWGLANGIKGKLIIVKE